MAAFAQRLRGGQYLNDFSYAEIQDLAVQSRGEDSSGYRDEMLQLLSLVSSLSTSSLDGETAEEH